MINILQNYVDNDYYTVINLISIILAKWVLDKIDQFKHTEYKFFKMNDFLHYSKTLIIDER